MARRLILTSVVFLFCVFIVVAQFRTGRREDWKNWDPERALARLQTDSGLVHFEPLDPGQFYVLTVSGNEGFVSRTEFFPNEAILFPMVDEDGAELPDGTYSYQLRVLTDPGGEGQSRRETSWSARSDRAGGPLVSSQSGSFEIVDGAPVVPKPSMDVAPMDQVYPVDDHLLRGNTCIGTPCSDGEDFPKDGYYPVLKVKGIEPTIFLADTTGGDTSWQVTADDGSSNEFAITEVIPGPPLTEIADQLTIKSGARDNALYVDSSGRVGIGTLPDSTAELHILSTASEANLRLEHASSARTFTLSNYSAAFAVDGQVLDILKLAWDAPKYSLTAGINGVGVGTDQAAAALHVKKTDNTKVLVEEDSAVAANRLLFELKNNGSSFFKFTNTFNGQQWTLNPLGTSFTFDNLNFPGQEFRLYNTGRLVITPSSLGSASFDLATNGDLTIAGDLTAKGVVYPSDRSLKEDIQEVDTREILEKVVKLPVSTWHFREEPKVRHAGPMAQDFHELFGLGKDNKHLNPTDTTGVALAAIQGLYRELQEELRKRNAEIAELKSRLIRLEARESRLDGLDAEFQRLKALFQEQLAGNPGSRSKGEE